MTSLNAVSSLYTSTRCTGFWLSWPLSAMARTLTTRALSISMRASLSSWQLWFKLWWSLCWPPLWWSRNSASSTCSSRGLIKHRFGWHSNSRLRLQARSCPQIWPETSSTPCMRASQVITIWSLKNSLFTRSCPQKCKASLLSTCSRTCSSSFLTYLASVKMDSAMSLSYRCTQGGFKVGMNSCGTVKKLIQLCFWWKAH